MMTRNPLAVWPAQVVLPIAKDGSFPHALPLSNFNDTQEDCTTYACVPAMYTAGPAPPGLFQRTEGVALRQKLRLQDDFVSRNSPDIPIKSRKGLSCFAWAVAEPGKEGKRRARTEGVELAIFGCADGFSCEERIQPEPEPPF